MALAERGVGDMMTAEGRPVNDDDGGGRGGRDDRGGGGDRRDGGRGQNGDRAPRPQATEADIPMAGPFTAYVGNLAFSTTAQALGTSNHSAAGLPDLLLP